MQCDIRRRRMDSPQSVYWNSSAREVYFHSLSLLRAVKSLLPSPSVCLARWKVYPPTPNFGLRLSEVVNNIRKVLKSSVTTPGDPQTQSMKLK